MPKTFEEIRRDFPRIGDILDTVTGQPIKLTEESREENGVLKKGIFCRVVVSVEKQGWFASDEGVGVICFILPRAQRELVRNEEGKFTVQKLRVVKYLENGRAILAELGD